MKEEKVAMTIELGASRSDKELIQALHRRLSMEEDRRLDLAKTIREVSQTIISLVWPLHNEIVCNNFYKDFYNNVHATCSWRRN